MSASLSGQQFHQLPLYVQAKELHSEKMTKGDLDPEYESHGSLMRNKLQSAYEEGLVHSVAQRGVQNPVRVDWDKNTLLEGHHRVAAANRVNPESWVPVRAISDKEYWESGND